MDVVQGQHRTVGLVVLHWGEGNLLAMTAKPLHSSSDTRQENCHLLPPQ